MTADEKKLTLLMQMYSVVIHFLASCSKGIEHVVSEVDGCAGLVPLYYQDICGIVFCTFGFRTGG